MFAMAACEFFGSSSIARSPIIRTASSLMKTALNPVTLTNRHNVRCCFTHHDEQFTRRNVLGFDCLIVVVKLDDSDRG